MPSTPRPRIDDGYLAGKTCAICGAASLTIARIAGLPDHVNCGSCGSVFVVEDGGERVMYGKIPAEYPATRLFALRQWAWLEAVERKAASEQQAGRPASPPAPQEAGPPLAAPAPSAPEDTEAQASAYPAPSISRPPVEYPAERDQAAALPPATPLPEPAAKMPQAEPLPAVFRTRPDPAAAEPAAPPTPTGAPRKPPKPARASPQRQSAEPPAGQRFRVVTTGESVAFPWKVCAHCLRSPAPGRVSIVGVLPDRTQPSRSRSMTLTLPLCADCQRRARARSGAEKSARLQAFLVSTLVSLLLFVGVLATQVVDFSQSLGLSLLILAVLLAIGYGVVLPLLLSRARRLPPPDDATYVRSTLRIASGGQEGEVAFEWRNRGYADLFHQANQERARGGATPVADPAPAPPRTP